MKKFVKVLNKVQVVGIIIALIASVFALINENDTNNTIAGVITTIRV